MTKMRLIRDSKYLIKKNANYDISMKFRGIKKMFIQIDRQ